MVNILTAEDARGLMPVADLDEILDNIDDAIRAAAEQGKYRVDVYSLVPKFSTWDQTRATAVRTDVIHALRAKGFKVEQHSGGHIGGSASLYVDWSPSR